jgi:hypothetical protein
LVVAAETNTMCCSNGIIDATIAKAPVVAHGSDCETLLAGFLVLGCSMCLAGPPYFFEHCHQIALFAGTQAATNFGPLAECELLLQRDGS